MSLQDLLNRRTAAGVAVAVSMIALTACSQRGAVTADASADATVTADATADVTADATADVSAPSGDLVDTAAAAGSFSTLIAAVQAAGLESVLRGPGPYTVFAPTDEAFASSLPEGTVELLMQPSNNARLVQILQYHIISGELMSADVAGSSVARATLEGREVEIDGTSGFEVDGVTITSADVEASNGVIHVINEVLLP